MTLIVLLILASVSISAIWSGDGIFSRATEVAFKTNLSKIAEEFDIYVATKQIENYKFSRATLVAGKGEGSLWYNTMENEERGNIQTVIGETGGEYINNFEIIKGELIYSSQNKKELKWAQEIGIKINPYLIIDGELISSDTNLMLMDATGTIVIPESVKSIGEGTFASAGVRRIIIPATVKEIKNNAFNNNTTLEEIIILSEGENGIEKIGDYAFANCINLKSIQMPNTVNYLGKNAFESCSKLENIQLSSKIEIINNFTFWKCSNLKEVNIQEGTKAINQNVFQGCVELKKIIIPNSLETIQNTAFFSTAMEEIEITSEHNNFIYEKGMLLKKDRSEIYAITKSAITGNTFWIPEGVKNLSIGVMRNPSFNSVTKFIIPKSVTYISASFFPDSVNEIEIDENNSKYVSINGMICSKDKKILYTVYSKNTVITIEEGIEEISQGAFTIATKAKEINFPTSIKKIRKQAFTGIKVKSIKLGKNVNNIEKDAFSYNNYLEDIEIDKDNPTYIAENGAVYTKDKKILIAFVNNIATSFEIPSGVEEITDYAIFNRVKLEQLIIPNTVITIKQMAFNGCSALTKLDIPNSVKKIENLAFNNCTNLKSININNSTGSITGSPWGCPFGQRAIKWLK